LAREVLGYKDGSQAVRGVDGPALKAESKMMTSILDRFRDAEDIMHFIVAAALMALAGYVLFRETADFISTGHAFAERVTAAVNGVLFVIIVLELLRTVLAHFEEAGFQLKPFLVIGIISAVRHILTVGAQLSLGSEKGDAFRHAQIELGVSAGVVLALVIGLVLVHRSGAAAD
jgi:uncharacterized membrane protein (DUF373 family)